ncbi:Cupredoxin [Phaeosphaeria sp. MPI-PUGE-AT-0046c]|nr:Cupredoxin [Phaeosphaeria sp. MPI-PUGE-AT-0046c]
MKYLLFSLAALSSSRVNAQRFGGNNASPKYTEMFQNPLPFPPDKAVSYTYKNSTTGNEIDFYEVDVKPFEQQVYKGLQPARLIGYDGMSPGPTFRMKKGREAVVRFKNHGDNDMSVHLHGCYTRAPFDGWAEDITKPGEYKDYYYPNSQSARTLWYHDHAVGQTAENAYFGQAGFYILHDPAEDALGLPKGKYDLPLALSSKQYNSDGTLYNPKDEHMSMEGDVIQVNGQPWPYHAVEPRKYRLRWLDSSISRTFKLSFVDDSGKAIPFQVVGSDTGLLTKPVTSSDLEISMAERWELIFDFSAYAGQNVTVKNADENRRGGGNTNSDDDTDKVMRFVVGTSVSDSSNNANPPSSLRTVPFPANTKSGKADRSFNFEMVRGVWEVNGVTFADTKNRILANPPRGSIEIWSLTNGNGGMAHPVHIHLVDFQILSRTGGQRGVLDYEKEALKDVVLVERGETVTVIARYAPYDGVYMFHCHNLVHEDHDMMAAFNVTDLKDFGYPETTKLQDPMEKRWRAKTISEADDRQTAVMDKCALFESLGAYEEIGELEEALEEYWENGGKTPATMQTVVKSAVASRTAAPSAAVTSGSSVRSVRRRL